MSISKVARVIETRIYRRTSGGEYIRLEIIEQDASFNRFGYVITPLSQPAQNNVFWGVETFKEAVESAEHVISGMAPVTGIPPTAEKIS
jgi:hypothetical protein